MDETYFSSVKNVLKEVEVLPFLAAVHDIGKLAPEFQVRVADVDELMKTCMDKGLLYAMPVHNSEKNIRHEAYSAYLFEKYCDIMPCFRDGLKRTEKSFLPNVLLMHHQGEQKGAKTPYEITERIISLYGNIPIGSEPVSRFEDEVAMPMMKALADIFPIQEEKLLALSKRHRTSDYEYICGMVMLSDWIASGEHFADTEDMVVNDFPAWKERLKNVCADMHLETYHLPEISYESTFQIKNPRPIQEEIQKILAEHEDFDICLIEAPMGEGKTEAGLYAALTMQKRKGLGGVYMALPTGATSSAMQKRFAKILENAGYSGKPDLVTGTSVFTEEEYEEKDLLLRKLRLLSPYATGTIDQILTAVQNSYLNEMKLTCLCGKVLVIDEIHAYDRYMLVYIKQLLAYCKNASVHVILMSATLDKEMKKELFAEYGTPAKEGYPLITIGSGDTLYEYTCDSAKKEVRLPISYATENENIEDGICTDSKEACGLVIINRVQDSITTYDRIKERVGDDTRVILLHSNMTMADREKKEKEILALFGTDRTRRPLSAIVVSTQIISMSMDVDFDFLYSEETVVDELLQRLGRIRRHEDTGTARERGFVPYAKIFSMGNVRPYDEHQIEISRKIIGSLSEIKLPSDIQPLVNAAYIHLPMDDIKKARGESSQIDAPGEDLRKRVLQSKQREVPTRLGGGPTIDVFTGSNEELQLILKQPLPKKDSIELYRRTVVRGVSFYGNNAESLDTNNFLFKYVYQMPESYQYDHERGLVNVQYKNSR